MRQYKIDHPKVGHSISPELRGVDPGRLDFLNAEDFAIMSLDDPLLKYAYVQIFTTSSLGLVGKMTAQQELALADLRRRGESAGPMLLKLIEENQETQIESCILGLIDRLGTVRIDPFLEYARKILRERPQSENVAGPANLLARHGTKEDIELLEWVQKQGPFAELDIPHALRVMRERLNGSSARRCSPGCRRGRDRRSLGR